MKKTKNDLLARATRGKHRWNDPGMDANEAGLEDFPIGTRVEVRTINPKTKRTVWRRGTVVESWDDNKNERGICVVCDKRWHNNLSFFNGHGAGICVFMNTRRAILSNIRKIDE